MNVVSIADGRSGSEARIAVDLGFNCYRFLARLNPSETVSVIAAADGFENGGHPACYHGIPILFPFPNRIRGGRFAWGGREWTMPAGVVPDDGRGNAIHGFCADRPWRVVQQTPESVTGEFQLSVDAPDRRPLWPADAVIAVRYSVKGCCLRADIEIRNPSDDPLPWGFGTHPYFRMPLSTVGEPGQCTVFAPSETVWILDDSYLPTGSQRPARDDVRLADSPWFDQLRLDDIYTNLQRRNGASVCCLMDERGSVQVEQRSSTDFREIVAFTPPWMSAVCLEPYTCVTDAINLQQRGIDAGLQVLAPGAVWRGWIEIEAQPVVC